MLKRGPAPKGAVRSPGPRHARRRGQVLLVVGPDGVGKSSLCQQLAARAGERRPVLHIHHRVRLFPGRAGASKAVTDPHAAPPYPAWLSLLKLLYLYVELRLTWALSVRPILRRGGLVIFERGWWDLLVDPWRYRLSGPSWPIRLLSRLIPQPDLLIVLEAPVSVLSARKAELDPAELARQAAAWRAVLPPTVRHVFLDASRPTDEVVRTAQEALASAGATADRVGPQVWVRIPVGRRRRPWAFPRAPRAAAAAAFRVYQPMNRRALAVWQALRLGAALGGMQLLPAADAPRDVCEALEGHVPADSLIAAASSNHAGHWAALVLSPTGELRAMAKIARDEAGHRRLEREADALQQMSCLLTPPLSAPRLLDRGPDFILLEPIDWQVRLRPWILPVDVAEAIGRFYRAGALAGTVAATGLAHGDFAPWNLLRTADGWSVIDWEDVRTAAPPFYDLFHYLVQAHALLGRPTLDDLLAGLDGKGRVGAAIEAYARGAGLRVDAPSVALATYLELSGARIDPSVRGYRVGMAARQVLIETLARTGGLAT